MLAICHRWTFRLSPSQYSQPERDLPETFGPYTTCYNRFVRWARAGIWDQIMDALGPHQQLAEQRLHQCQVGGLSC
jgi:hypothetical protein